MVWVKKLLSTGRVLPSFNGYSMKTTLSINVKRITMKRRLLFLATIIVALFLSGCNKNEDFTTEDLTIAEDEVFAIATDETADLVINPASFGGQVANADAKGPGMFRFFPFKDFPACAVVTVSNSDFPKEIVIDFDGECDTWHGRAMSGKIVITVSDTIINEGATVKVHYDNVKLGLRTIERESLLTNEGMNENGNWVISFTSTMSITYGNGHVSVREFSGEKEWISGFLTPQITDDKFFKTGSGTITVDDNFKFSRVITAPLYIDRACRFILSGKVEITRGGETMIIDYGDGQCDNVATVTKNGETLEIELGACKFRDENKKHIRNFRNNKGWW